MAVTNKLGVWGKTTDSDFGDTWFSVSNGLVEGFKPNTYNYATKMNQALRNSSLMAYVFAQILENANLPNTINFNIDPAVTDANLNTLVTNITSAINYYIQNKAGKVASASTADSASTLGNTTIGSTVRPIYLNNGSPEQCDEALWLKPISVTANQTVDLVSGKSYLIVPDSTSVIKVTQNVYFQYRESAQLAWSTVNKSLNTNFTVSLLQPQTGYTNNDRIWSLIKYAGDQEKSLIESLEYYEVRNQEARVTISSTGSFKYYILN